MKTPTASFLLFAALGFGGLFATGLGAQPAIANLRIQPRGDTGWVDILYDLTHAQGLPCTIRVQIAPGRAASFASGGSLSGAVGPGITPGASRRIEWHARQDLGARELGSVTVRLTADDGRGGVGAPPGFVLLPAGTFLMGAASMDVGFSAAPPHAVTVSSFALGRTELPYSEWKLVVDWRAANDPAYDFAAGQRGAAFAGEADSDAHPVTRVSWWDVVKWCNARSRREGLTPCYYTDAALTTELKSGYNSVATGGLTAVVHVNWLADGYRLPTEAEWEYAARGGLEGKEYPWGDGIAANQANYAYSAAPLACTTPVGYFNGQQNAPGPDMRNGFGLYDMAGNVWEWVWDWAGPYPAAAQTDPRGAVRPDYGRLTRGGAYTHHPMYARCAVRWGIDALERAHGFRAARRPGPPFVDSAPFALDLRAPVASRLTNLSTRAMVRAGEVLTPGFVISGSGPKRLLIRALGPALNQFGIPAAMLDPQVELIPAGSDTALLQNNNWPGTAELTGAFAAVGAFPLAPGSLDAALQANLGVGAYSARVRAAAGSAAGVALVEIYDADAEGSTAARLVNVSTLGFAGTDANVLSPGFYIRGAAPLAVLIRAVGPSLSAFGVGDPLLDPRLTLFAAGREAAVVANDNWGGTEALKAAFRAAGAFALPEASADAAVAIALPPGGYSAVVSGAGGATGTCLVEIYELPVDWAGASGMSSKPSATAPPSGRLASRGVPTAPDEPP